jgi:hypothetical protein
MNWLRRKWVQSAAYWGGVAALMLSDGSLGWDDVAIFLVALPVYVKLILRSKP